MECGPTDAGQVRRTAEHGDCVTSVEPLAILVFKFDDFHRFLQLFEVFLLVAEFLEREPVSLYHLRDGDVADMAVIDICRKSERRAVSEIAFIVAFLIYDGRDELD